MAIKQLSIFIENKEGKLSDTIKIISDADINIRALSIGDSQDFGILRLIVSDTEKAISLLKEDYIVKETEVIAVKMDDKEGALYKILKVFEDAKINVELTPEQFSDKVSDIQAMEKALEGAMRTMLGIGPKVHLVAPKSIVRSEGKAVRVIDNRKLHD